jgi:hypothetical protein
VEGGGLYSAGFGVRLPAKRFSVAEVKRGLLNSGEMRGELDRFSSS